MSLRKSVLSIELTEVVVNELVSSHLNSNAHTCRAGVLEMTCWMCKECMEVVVNAIGPPTWRCPECGMEIPEGFPIDNEYTIDTEEEA